jgi:uncharacterized membrane protein YfcA
MLEVMLLFGAGVLGGMMNAIAGGGSFITFPALIAAGVPPISANATNTYASCAGYISGALGFRHELWAHRQLLPRIMLSSLFGGALGAWLLIQTSPQAFAVAIPWLLLFATVLLVYGHRLQAVLRDWFGRSARASALGMLAFSLALLVISIYGGFFNAGLGIILLGFLTLAGYTDVHLMNGIKLLVSAVVALIAITIFASEHIIAWYQGSIVLVGTLLGGYGAAITAKWVNPIWIRRLMILIAGVTTAYFFAASMG